MTIVWSTTAKDRLIEILDFISRDNPIAAVHLIDQIELKVSTLHKNPFMGKKLHELSDHNIRELVVHIN